MKALFALAFGLVLLLLASLLVVYLTVVSSDHFGGPVMALMGVLTLLLSVGLVEGRMGNRGEKP